ncbi:hypothetical protein CYMTET_3101 [Cymbomonas tetramitiformis]|uniref:Uncharacterized protein n=1 Tax=Cymbomonas tetramitiformis TaxID=36881 RepID=A0AAE0LLX0_9CHLO|nr:hypothetical protein CYMTET_3101 [Cymbomonas tetramitiformis]
MKRALLEITNRLASRAQRPLQHYEEIFTFVFKPSSDPEPLVQQLSDCLSAIADSPSGPMPEMQQKRQLLAWLDYEFYHDGITPLRLNSDLDKVDNEDIYTHLVGEYFACVGSA